MTLLLAVILTALVFEYINGFHDSANAIATVVSTKVLSARAAVIYAGCLDIVGAFLGTHVAGTIGQGIVQAEIVTQGVILCALLSGTSSPGIWAFPPARPTRSSADSWARPRPRQAFP